MRKKPSISWKCAIIIAVGASLAWAAMDALHLTQRLDWQSYDAAYRRREPHMANEGVVIVGITDEDIAHFGRFPWSRAEQSVIYEKLAELRPAVVVSDILYTEPGSGDERLSAVLGALDNVTLAFYCNPQIRADPLDTSSELLTRSGDPMGADLSHGVWKEPGHPVLPVASVAGSCDRVGHVVAQLDPDGIARRVPIVVHLGDRLVPTLGLQASLQRLDVSFSNIRVSPQEVMIANVPNRGTVRLPLDGAGNLLVAYPGDLEESFVGVSVTQLVNGEVPDLAGKMVFVGLAATAQSHADRFATPVSASMPGVAIHAAVASMILDNDFIRPARPWHIWILSAVLALLASSTIKLLRPIIGGLVVAGLLLVFGFVTTRLVAASGLWIPMVVPVGAGLSAAIIAIVSVYVNSEIQREQVRAVFGRYFPPHLLDAALATPELHNAVGRRIESTVLFSDIRKFTARSEASEPEEVVAILNQYFEKMIAIAYKHEGTINKLIGDAIMIFFNDPIKQEDHALRCVEMAIEMQEAIPEINQMLTARGDPTLEVGMGICTDYVTVGNIGSAQYSDYTVIGSAVNLAARLTSEAGPGEILVARKTYAMACDKIHFIEHAPIDAKNDGEPVPVWRAMRRKEGSQ